MFAVSTIVSFFALALFGENLSPFPPNQVDLGARFSPPFWQEGGSIAHFLGTDGLGRDILSRIMIGARNSCIVAIFSLFLGGFLGTVIGIVSGYFGGIVDGILMRMGDATIAFPIILLAILLSIILGPSLLNVVAALGLVLWARYARVIRGEVLSLKERDFVALARVAGASDLRIMVKHILPNIYNTLLVLLTLQVGWVIIVEAALSFMGAGLPGPDPVWGSMVAKGRQYVTSAWWVPFMPGMAIAIVCLSFNMLGDWLREVLDPRMRQVE
ncbi:MAG: ABC transporter permease [SAR324 cluster bacterium]|nr:ABC transporter permease [SAR324 cluster bacterium]